MSNNSSTASRVAAHNLKGVPYTGWIEGVGYLAANPSIDWAVARKKGALIYPGELLEIPPVFEVTHQFRRAFWDGWLVCQNLIQILGIGRTVINIQQRMITTIE